jgi:phage replication O-like protein O
MEEGSTMTDDIQVENGSYTRIHNKILELLATARLSPVEFRIVLFIMRKTYGFQKKTDIISISQFQSNCNASHDKIIKSIHNLERLKVITREPAGKQMFSYGFNKYFEQWLPETFESRRPNQADNFITSTPKETSPIKGTSNPDDTSTSNPNDTGTSNPNGTHKRKKETIKEIPDNNSHQLIFSALSRVCKVDPKLKGGMIGKIAKSLLLAGYTADDVNRFEFWWRGNDFRGKQGSPPTLNQVVELIMQSKSATAMPEKQSGTVKVILPSGEITEARR